MKNRVSYQEIVEAKAFPPGTSAQKAELTALTCTLQVHKNNKIIIYILTLNMLFLWYTLLEPFRRREGS